MTGQNVFITPPERPDSKVSSAAAAGGTPLKILYAAALSPNDSALYRLWAL